MKYVDALERSKADPDGMFLNTYLEKVLYPKGHPVREKLRKKKGRTKNKEKESKSCSILWTSYAIPFMSLQDKDSHCRETNTMKWLMNPEKGDNICTYMCCCFYLMTWCRVLCVQKEIRYSMYFTTDSIVYTLFMQHMSVRELTICLQHFFPSFMKSV